MAAALIIVLAVAAMFLMAAPAPSGASPDPMAEAKAAHLILVHQSAVDSVRASGSPGPGRLPDGFVTYPDWFAASEDFVSGSNGGTVVATWLEAEPRLWGEVAMALGRRKSTKAAIGTIDRSTGSPELVATFEGRPVRFTGLGPSVIGAPSGAPAIVTMD